MDFSAVILDLDDTLVEEEQTTGFSDFAPQAAPHVFARWAGCTFFIRACERTTGNRSLRGRY
jgi:hypothetical protein